MVNPSCRNSKLRSAGADRFRVRRDVKKQKERLRLKPALRIYKQEETKKEEHP